MSIATYRTVVCDRCRIESDAGSTPAEARRIAKAQGWDRRKDTFAVPAVFRDLCPNCAGSAPESEEAHDA